MDARLSVGEDAVAPVEQALATELAAVPPGSEQAKAAEELGAALLRRASLDNQAEQRRADRIADLQSGVDAVLPGTAGATETLLEALSENADELAARALSDPDVAEALRDIASLLVETDLPEVTPHRSNTPSRDASTAYQTTARPTVSEEQLLACLRAHSKPGVTIHRITDLRMLSGGFSKEMLAATVEHSAGTDDIVIRKVAAGRTATTLGGEFAALSFAWQGGVPVAEPLWLDEHALGMPAFATRRVAGECLGDVWGPAAPVEREAASAIAAALARLHSLDTVGLTDAPLPPMVTQREIISAIEERRGVLDAVSTPSTPFAALFALVLGWLRAHAPDDVRDPVLVHGDFGLHNLLLDGTTLTAVLDWERSHLGHPAEDLTYLRPSIEPVLDWELFLAAYQDAGGPTPDADRLTFYTVWHDVWRGISAYRMRTKFLTDPRKISDAMAGLLMTPRFLLRAARTAFRL